MKLAWGSGGRVDAVRTLLLLLLLQIASKSVQSLQDLVLPTEVLLDIFLEKECVWKPLARAPRYTISRYCRHRSLQNACATQRFSGIERAYALHRTASEPHRRTTPLYSQAFKKSHGGSDGGDGKAEGEAKKPGFIVAAGGMGKIRELIVEPPTPLLYHAPIIEPTPPEHQGGLWEFEDEPSYFDGDM